MKSLFEQMGGTYTQQGDYFLPDLKLPPEEERPIGVWAGAGCAISVNIVPYSIPT